jgi:hypothetical protein
MKKNYFNWRKTAVAFFAIGFLSFNGFGQLYPFSEHIFTNAGAEGKDGPSLAECQAAYAPEAWVLDPAFFNMSTNGIQEWTVPSTGDYRIEVAGAQGGYHAYTVDPEDGGLGAIVQGDFELVEGQVLYILVGQEGEASQEGGSFNEDNAAPGGGGGSFVWDPDADPALPMMAAGGGGAGASPGGYALKDATVAVNGNPTQGLSNGGLDGNGGRQNNGSCSWWAGAGAGWLTNGTGGNMVTAYNYLPGGSGAQGGRSPLSGGFGGVRWNDGLDEGGDGGFGGGGGGGSDNMNGGGGGGFSGGGGGRGCEISPGGGGSYNGGTDQVNTVANEGHGWVRIELLCTPLTLVATPTGVCAGESVTLTATSVTGGDVSWDMGIDNGVSFVPPLGETIYSCASTSPEDCNLTVTVTSTEVPDITANSSSPVACGGTVITLWGEGGDTYTWDLGVEDSVAFPAPGVTTTYTLIGSLLDCEAPPVEITMEVEPQPDIAGVATPAQICLGESFVLTGEGDAATYNWGATIDDGDEVTPATAGTFAYVVIGNSDAGCGDTAIVYVTVFGLPEVNGGSDVAVCEGEEVTLSGSGAPTLEWSPMITDGEPFEAMAGTNVYTLTGTDANGCEDTDEVTVTGVEVPVITDAVVTDEFFGYDGSIDITVEGGSGAYTYEWSHGPVSQDVGSLTAGTYTVIVNDITVEKGLCETEGTYEIGSFVGLEDQSLVNLNVYPNPVVDEFTIATEGTFNYDVVNLLGEVILSGQGTTSVQVSMKDFANGTYIVKVKSGEQTGFVQVVKH